MLLTDCNHLRVGKALEKADNVLLYFFLSFISSRFLFAFISLGVMASSYHLLACLHLLYFC